MCNGGSVDLTATKVDKIITKVYGNKVQFRADYKIFDCTICAIYQRIAILPYNKNTAFLSQVAAACSWTRFGPIAIAKK